MKVVINDRYGGFGLSSEALEFLGMTAQEAHEKYYLKNRNDPKLVECVEKLGSRANGQFALLRIIEIPDMIDYVIWDIEGDEVILEKGHYWWGINAKK